MKDTDREAAARAGAGLCGTCRHARTIASDRGSVFLLCRRSRNDPRYARYPRLPVHRCPGYEPDPSRAAPGPGGGA